MNDQGGVAAQSGGGGGNLLYGALGTCSLSINTTLPLVCICSLFSFLCGVGIGANDLSANFAMVVGSGSLNMKQAIIYCSVFELLGAAFMGGHVSSTIRNGIVELVLFNGNRDVVVIGMTAASFAAALWLYMSTATGLPVSITHTVVGSLLGFAFFSTFSLNYVKARGVAVIVISWVAAPVCACLVTAVIFYFLRRDVFKVKGHSFERALAVLPGCFAASFLVDYAFVLIEKPPVMTQTLAAHVPVWGQFLLLLAAIFATCYAVTRWYFPHVARDAWAASSFVWESRSIRTEAVNVPQSEADEAEAALDNRLSFFRPPQPAAAAIVVPVGGSSSRGGRSSAGSSSSGLSSGDEPELEPSGSGSGSGTPLVPLDAAGDSQRQRRPRSRARRDAPATTPPVLSRMLSVTGSSVVLSSINASDSRVVSKGTGVRLAPTGGRRSPMPQSSAAVSRDRSACGTPRSRPQPFSDTSYGTMGSVGNYTNTNTNTNLSYSSGNMSGEPSLCAATVVMEPSSPTSVHSEDEFGDEDWALDHRMEPIRFGGLLIKPFNPRAEYLFTSLQVVAGSMSSFVHGAVAGANATATFVILYEAFTNHELGQPNLSSQWAVLPAMLGIAIGMFALGASLMKTVGMELVTVTPARGWCIQVGGTTVTMVLTAIGIPVSLSQAQVGAAIGCGVLDARLAGVSWSLVAKIVCGWVVTLFISAATTGLAMWFLAWMLC